MQCCRRRDFALTDPPAKFARKDSSADQYETLAKVCDCGNVFVYDALYCRMCGKKRSALTQPTEKPDSAARVSSSSGLEQRSPDSWLFVAFGDAPIAPATTLATATNMAPNSLDASSSAADVVHAASDAGGNETIAAGTPQEEAAKEPEPELNAVAAACKRAAERLEECEAEGIEIERKFEELFNGIDSNKSGSVAPDTLKAYFEAHPSTKLELGIANFETFLAEVDDDGNGVIDRDEFVAYLWHKRFDKNKCYGAIFDAIDVSGDGSLQYKEVREFQWYCHPKIFQLLGIPDFTSMAADMDADGDGDITREEFTSFLIRVMEGGSTVVESAPPAGTEKKAVKSSSVALPANSVAPAPDKKTKLAEVLQKPAWKRAVETAKEWDEMSGWKQEEAKKRKPGPGECWDYTRGYCHRGQRCKWKHIGGVVDNKTLNAQRTFCLKLAGELGLRISEHALKELQTLSEAGIDHCLRGVAPGGNHAYVKDKNYFLIHESRRIRFKSFAGRSPDEYLNSY